MSSFIHITKKTVNFYTANGRYQSSGKVGYSPEMQLGCYGRAVELEGPPEQA